MVFATTKYKKYATPDIALNGVRVKFAKLVRYLGVLVHAVLKQDNDIQR